MSKYIGVVMCKNASGRAKSRLKTNFKMCEQKCLTVHTIIFNHVQNTLHIN